LRACNLTTGPKNSLGHKIKEPAFLVLFREIALLALGVIMVQAAYFSGLYRFSGNPDWPTIRFSPVGGLFQKNRLL